MYTTCRVTPHSGPARHAYLVVSAGGVEGVGTAGKQRLVVAWDQDFDIVVAFVLQGVKQPCVTAEHGGCHLATRATTTGGGEGTTGCGLELGLMLRC